MTFINFVSLKVEKFFEKYALKAKDKYKFC